MPEQCVAYGLVCAEAVAQTMRISFRVDSQLHVLGWPVARFHWPYSGSRRIRLVRPHPYARRQLRTRSYVEHSQPLATGITAFADAMAQGVRHVVRDAQKINRAKLEIISAPPIERDRLEREPLMSACTLASVAQQGWNGARNEEFM